MIGHFGSGSDKPFRDVPCKSMTRCHGRKVTRRTNHEMKRPQLHIVDAVTVVASADRMVRSQPTPFAFGMSDQVAPEDV